MPDVSDGPAETLSDLFVQHCRALRAWLDAGNETAPPDLAAALAAWRTAHPQTGEAFERTLVQGARYVGLIEELLRLGAARQPGEAGDDDWRRLIEALREPLVGGTITDGDWLPVWQALAGRLPAVWSALAPWLPASATGTSLADELHRGLSLPGLAPHAAGALWQTLATAWQTWAAAEADYRALLDEATRTTAARLRTSVRRAPPATVRALYDRWIEESEAAWAELIREDRYATTQARLVHAMLQCRRAAQQLAADLGHGFGLPTRAEVDTLEVRLYDGRRRQQALERDVAALRAEVAALATRSGNAAS